MRDTWNPTISEIEKWAYSTEKLPDQDWELAVALLINLEVLIKLAKDADCPKHKFFLGALYVLVGDIVRSKDTNKSSNLIEMLQNHIHSESEDIKSWAERSLDLLENPSSYSYKYWGLGSKYIY
jgi:hypothetical protein